MSCWNIASPISRPIPRCSCTAIVYRSKFDDVPVADCGEVVVRDVDACEREAVWGVLAREGATEGVREGGIVAQLAGGPRRRGQCQVHE